MYRLVKRENKSFKKLKPTPHPKLTITKQTNKFKPCRHPKLPKPQQSEAFSLSSASFYDTISPLPDTETQTISQLGWLITESWLVLSAVLPGDNISYKLPKKNSTIAVLPTIS